MRNGIHFIEMTVRMTAAAAASVLVLLGLWSCAEERPTQPGPTRYRVYADFTGDRVYDSNGTY